MIYVRWCAWHSCGAEIVAYEDREYCSSQCRAKAELESRELLRRTRFGAYYA